MVKAQDEEARYIRTPLVCCFRTKQHDSRRGFLAGGQELKYHAIDEAVSVKLAMKKYKDELNPNFTSKHSKAPTNIELSNDLNYDCVGAKFINMTTACQEAFVIACLYEVVEGRRSASYWPTIINRESIERMWRNVRSISILKGKQSGAQGH